MKSILKITISDRLTIKEKLSMRQLLACFAAVYTYIVSDNAITVTFKEKTTLKEINIIDKLINIDLNG